MHLKSKLYNSIWSKYVICTILVVYIMSYFIFMRRNVPTYNKDGVLQFYSACRFKSGNTTLIVEGTNRYTFTFNYVRGINYIYLPLDKVYYYIYGTNNVRFSTLPFKPSDILD